MWLYEPSVFAPERVDSILPSNLLPEILSLSCTSRGKSKQPKFWQQGLKRDRWPRLTFGRICQLSMQASFEARLTCCSGGYRVPPSASLVNGKGMPMSGTSGPTSSESWESVAPPWSSSKTSHHLFPEDTSERSERDYRHWVTESKDRCSSLRATLGRRTGGSGYSSSQWKTPHGMGNVDASGKMGGAGGGEFAKQANQWQTPATDSFRSRGGERKDEQGLDQQARLWATPSARDHKGEASKGPKGTSRQRDLTREVKAFSHPDLATQKPGANCWCGSLGCDLRSHKRRLSPLFSAWLMNWPTWWCTKEPMPSAPAEMASYRSRVRSRLQFYLEGLND